MPDDARTFYDDFFRHAWRRYCFDCGTPVQINHRHFCRYCDLMRCADCARVHQPSRDPDYAERLARELGPLPPAP